MAKVDLSRIAGSNLNREDRALSIFLKKRVYFIRGKKVMPSTHLADLYGIEPRFLIRAFKRNRACFPEGLWAFQLNIDEFSVLKSQFGILEYSNIRRSLPYAFTEQGVVMLSGILRGKPAIAMNIAVIKFFVRKYRPFLIAHEIGPSMVK
jgi:hypothetical protein